MKKFLAIVIALLIVAGGIGYLVLRSRYAAELKKVQANAQEQVAAQQKKDLGAIEDLARDLSRTLAVTLADDIARKDYPAVEGQLGSIVRGRRVAGVLVLDQDGNVLAATDLRYHGRRMDDAVTRKALGVTAVTISDEPPAPGQMEIDVPVSSGGRRIATLRVFFVLAGS
ncbi:MAG: hypothetical protein GXP48_12205 [Acidobacteria bacterium]|nr:hypothetical protein [Acidobacteriota bacterium]